jgi:hypothetical protein
MDSNLGNPETLSLVGAEDIAISTHSINTINQNSIMRANKLPNQTTVQSGSRFERQRQILQQN